MRATPLLDADGSVRKWVGMNIDITDRKDAEARLNTLQAVTARLMAAASPEAVAEIILRDGVGATGAMAGTLYVRHGSAIDLIGVEGYDVAFMQQYQRIPLDAELPITEAMRLGEVIYVLSREARDSRFPGLAQALAFLPYQTSAYVPLSSNGVVLGALTLAFLQPRELTTDERAFIQTLADQAAQALERSQLYDQLRMANDRFQRAEGAAKGFSYEWDLATGQVERSAGLYAVLGYAPEDLAPTWEAWIALRHPDEPLNTKAETIAHLDGLPGDDPGFEFRARHRDGQYRWLHERVAVDRDADGTARRVIGLTVDVTERKRAEAMIQRQAQLIDLSYEPILVRNADDEIIDWNAGAERLYGYSAAEVVGKRSHDILKSAHPIPVAMLLTTIERDGTWTGEIRHIAKDGREVIVESHQQFVVIAGQRLILETNHDITERKRTERIDRFLAEAGEVLTASLDEEETLQRVARLAVPLLADQCVVDLFDEKGERLAITVAAADAAREEMLRTLRLQYVPDLSNPYSLVAAAVRTGTPQLVEQFTADLEARLAGGESVSDAHRAVLARSVLVAPLIVRGRTLGAISFGSQQPGRFGPEDLKWTEELARRCALAIANARLYQEAREAEATVRRLFDAGVIGLLVADGERIVDANDHLLEMIGYDREDVAAGRLEWPTMTPPEYAASDEQALRELAETGTCTPFEKEYVRRDGSRVPILLGAATLAHDPPRWVCFVLDLTRQRALERVQQDFLASVSHDLKGPLTTIRGRAELLYRQATRGSGDADSRLVDGLDRIVAMTGRMTTMVDELVDVAHLRAGQTLSLELEELDLVAFAQERVAEHQAATTDHHMRVVVTAPGLWGSWDARRLDRVFDNLLSNAIKYSPDGGDVIVTIERERDAVEMWAVLSVRDEGVGVPAADLPHIFERFRRGHNAVAVAVGTGIGLVGVKQIVEQHGGAITVTSDEGRGSTFTVWLPLAPTADEKPSCDS